MLDLLPADLVFQQPANREPPDPAKLGDEIARLAAHIDAATHRLLDCIRRFDESGEWARQGALSCAHWLSWRIGLDLGAAREKVRVARALKTLPNLDKAVAEGKISYAKARAVTRVASPDNEGTLVEMAQSSTGAQLEKLCRMLRPTPKDDQVVPGTDAAPAGTSVRTVEGHRYLSREDLSNGLVMLRVVLHPDEAALVLKAIELARCTYPAKQTPPPGGSEHDGAAGAPGGVTSESTPDRGSPAQSADSVAAPAECSPPTPVPAARRAARSPRRRLISRADALVMVAQGFLSTGHRKGCGAERTQIVLHLDQEVLGPQGSWAATLDDGTRLSAETFRRLACDAGLVPVGETNAGPAIDLGRRVRTVSPALRRALWLRDRGCRFPACTHRLFLHAHHIQHWAHGGATSVENCLLICTVHHRLLHEGGFTVSRAESGEFVFSDATGKVVPNVSSPALLEGRADELVAAWNSTAGHTIDHTTNLPDWDGEPVDYEDTVETFMAAHG